MHRVRHASSCVASREDPVLGRVQERIWARLTRPRPLRRRPGERARSPREPGPRLEAGLVWPRLPGAPCVRAAGRLCGARARPGFVAGRQACRSSQTSVRQRFIFRPSGVRKEERSRAEPGRNAGRARARAAWVGLEGGEPRSGRCRGRQEQPSLLRGLSRALQGPDPDPGSTQRAFRRREGAVCFLPLSHDTSSIPDSRVFACPLHGCRGVFGPLDSGHPVPAVASQSVLVGTTFSGACYVISHQDCLRRSFHLCHP